MCQLILTISKTRNALSKGKQKIRKMMNKGKSKAEILADNRNRGRAFEKKEFAKFKEMYSNAKSQVTVKVPSGKRARLDAIARDMDGNIVIREFKSSLTAPYTKNQLIVFEEMMEKGAEIVGKAALSFPGGNIIDPGVVVKVVTTFI